MCPGTELKGSVGTADNEALFFQRASLLLFVFKTTVFLHYNSIRHRAGTDKYLLNVHTNKHDNPVSFIFSKVIDKIIFTSEGPSQTTPMKLPT